MSENAAGSARSPIARLVTPLLVVAAIAVVVVFDPLGALVGSIDLGWISLPDMPGWLRWIGDLPGPGFLIVILVLVALGESGRRRKGDDEDAT